MNTTPDASRCLLAALAAMALGGCGAPHGGPSAVGAARSGPFYGLEAASGGNSAGSATVHSDEDARCAMHRGMDAAPAQRDMQGLSPEQRRERMEEMRRHCR